MQSAISPQLLEAAPVTSAIEKLVALYDHMDQNYTAVAHAYGFDCRGCEQSCCLTRFYHHTVVEYLYLVQGLRGISPDQQTDVVQRANEYCRAAEQADRNAETLTRMCPLNLQGRCRLYAHRPMICRLHGIAHEMQRPGGERALSPGCHEFSLAYARRPYKAFDRTPFYREMAQIEGALRRRLGAAQKTKMTVAQMVVRGLKTATPCAT